MKLPGTKTGSPASICGSRCNNSLKTCSAESATTRRWPVTRSSVQSSPSFPTPISRKPWPSPTTPRTASGHRMDGRCAGRTRRGTSHPNRQHRRQLLRTRRRRAVRRRRTALRDLRRPLVSTPARCRAGAYSPRGPRAWLHGADRRSAYSTSELQPRRKFRRDGRRAPTPGSTSSTFDRC